MEAETLIGGSVLLIAALFGIQIYLDSRRALRRDLEANAPALPYDVHGTIRQPQGYKSFVCTCGTVHIGKHLAFTLCGSCADFEVFRTKQNMELARETIYTNSEVVWFRNILEDVRVDFPYVIRTMSGMGLKGSARADYLNGFVSAAKPKDRFVPSFKSGGSLNVDIAALKAMGKMGASLEDVKKVFGSALLRGETILDYSKKMAPHTKILGNNTQLVRHFNGTTQTVVRGTSK